MVRGREHPDVHAGHRPPHARVQADRGPGESLGGDARRSLARWRKPWRRCARRKRGHRGNGGPVPHAENPEHPARFVSLRRTMSRAGAFGNQTRTQADALDVVCLSPTRRLGSSPTASCTRSRALEKPGHTWLILCSARVFRNVSRHCLCSRANRRRALLGFPDDLKLRSCATLFGAISPAGSTSSGSREVTSGRARSATLRLLKRGHDSQPPLE